MPLTSGVAYEFSVNISTRERRVVTYGPILLLAFLRAVLRRLHPRVERLHKSYVYKMTYLTARAQR